MASKTDVANWALYKLGETRVDNIETDSTEKSRILNQLYDFVRDSLLQKYPWNFCMKRSSLAANSASPVWGYEYNYTLPSDCLSVYEIEGNPEYKIEDGKILTDASAPLYISYQSIVRDTNKFSPLFIEAFATKLAIEACEKITQTTAKKDTLYQEYKLAINEAYAADAIEGVPDELPESSWLESRV